MVAVVDAAADVAAEAAVAVAAAVVTAWADATVLYAGAAEAGKQAGRGDLIEKALQSEC